MSILKNQKHEMEYDTSTKQAIFSKRNKTSDGFEFPERIFKDAGTTEVVDNNDTDESEGE